MAVTIRTTGKQRKYRFTGQGKGFDLLVRELRVRVTAVGGNPGNNASDRLAQQARRRSDHRVCLVVFPLLLLLSVGTLYFLEAEYRENVALHTSGERVVGEIVRLERGLLPRMTYRFVDAKGEIHEKETGFPEARTLRVSVGDGIRIFYLPVNPNVSVYKLESTAFMPILAVLLVLSAVGSIIMTVILCMGYMVAVNPGTILLPEIWLLRPGETVEDRLAKMQKKR